MVKKRKNFISSNTFKVSISMILIILIGVFAMLMIFESENAVHIDKRFININENSIYIGGESFISSNEKEFNYYNIKNNKLNYSVDINTNNANVAGAIGINVVYNNNSINIVGTRKIHEIDGRIIKVTCGAGYVAVLIENTDNSETILIYNSAGDECMNIHYKSSMLMDFGFEAYDSSVFWTVELITAGSSTSTTITTYDLSKNRTTSVISIQGQLVDNVFFTENSIFTFCTNNMIRFDRKTNKEVYRLLTYGYQCNSFSQNENGKVLFILNSENEDDKHVKLLSVSESETANDESYVVKLEDNTICYSSMKYNLIVVTNSGVFRYDDNGALSRTTLFDEKIDNAIFMDNDKILISSGNSYRICTLVKDFLEFLK